MPLVVPAVVTKEKGDLRVASKVPAAADVSGTVTDDPPGTIGMDETINAASDTVVSRTIPASAVAPKRRKDCALFRSRPVVKTRFSIVCVIPQATRNYQG